MDFLADRALMGSVSLVLFFVFFAGVLAWIYRPGGKEKYQELGRIPLNDEMNDAPENGKDQ